MSRADGRAASRWQNKKEFAEATEALEAERKRIEAEKKRIKDERKASEKFMAPIQHLKEVEAYNENNSIARRRSLSSISTQSAPQPIAG